MVLSRGLCPSACLPICSQSVRLFTQLVVSDCRYFAKFLASHVLKGSVMYCFVLGGSEYKAFLS